MSTVEQNNNNDNKKYEGEKAFGFGFGAGNFGMLAHVCVDKVMNLPEGTVMTTSQMVAYYGIPVLAGILGSVVGAKLGYEFGKHNMKGVLGDAAEAVRAALFDKLPEMLGDAAAEISVKAKRIAHGIDKMAEQIVNQIKHKYQNKDDEQTLSQ